MKKRFFSLLMVMVMLTTIMATVAFASVEEVVVSIPAQKYSSSYRLWGSIDDARENTIILYVNEDEFPVEVTMRSITTEKEYTFDTYGIKRLSVKREKIDFLWLFLGFPEFYATIEIVRPEHETDKESEPENTPEDDSKPDDESIPEAEQGPEHETDKESEHETDKESEPENTPEDDSKSDVESTPEAEQGSELEPESETALEGAIFDHELWPENAELDFDTKLLTLFENIEFPEYMKKYCIQHIKDFASGEWSGEYKNESITTEDGDRRGRIYYGVSERAYNCRIRNSKDDILGQIDYINIDYAGPFEVMAGEDFSLAFDPATGTIEKWQFFEKQDSWQIPYKDDDEIINFTVFVRYYVRYDEESIGVVYVETNNSFKGYYLKPDHVVEQM